MQRQRNNFPGARKPRKNKNKKNPRKAGKARNRLENAGGNLPFDMPVVKRPRRTMKESVLFHAPKIANAAGGILTDIINGFGAYKVNRNSLMSGGIPQVRNGTKNDGVVISHTEYLGDITASIVFTIFNSLPLNPGMSQTFPWLSAIASAFEEYDFEGLIFFIKSTSSNALFSAANSTALGTIIVATQYDPLDELFSNKAQMLNYEYGTSSNPSESFCHPIECARSQTAMTHRYVRFEAVPAGGDIRLYDWGLTSIATVGMQAATGAIAELWVSYQVRLFKPKIQPGIEINQLLAAHYQLNTVTAAQPLGATVTLKYDTIGLAISPVGVIFPNSLNVGSFIMIWQCTGGSAATVLPAFTPTNATNLVMWKGNTVSGVNNGGTTTTTLINFLTFTITAIHAGVTVGTSGTLPTAVTSADLFLSQMPDGMNVMQLIENLDTPVVADLDSEEEESEEDEEWLVKKIRQMILLEKNGIKEEVKSLIK